MAKDIFNSADLYNGKDSSASTGGGVTPAVPAPADNRTDTQKWADDYLKDHPDDDPERKPGSGSGGTTKPKTTSSASPSIDTTADPYAADRAAAAATTQRITQGVDMSEKIAEANNAWDQATQNYGEQANGVVNQLEENTNQNLDQYQGNAQQIIDQLSGITGQQLADYAASTGQTIAQATDQINQILTGLQDQMKPVEAGRVGRVDTVEEENLLQQIVQNQQEQSRNNIDYNVQRATNELQRAEEDAQNQFQAQRNQIAGQEKTALDNSALYSEMRGDRGGIGKAQYDAIANTAATNQLTVNQQQTKLATDTARQIADLRAQGEFQKADELLKITQSYLSQLMQLKQWADETNVSIDEFNIGVEQWEQEYNSKIQQLLGEMGMNAVQYETGLNLDRQQYLTNQGLNAANTEASQRLSLESDVERQRQSLNDALAQYGLSNAQYMTNSDINRLTNTLNAYMQNAQNLASTEMAAANVTGAFGDETQTLAARDQEAQRVAAAATQMIAAGVKPTDAQLKALGWGRDQYNAYKKAIAAAQARRGGGGKTSANDLYSQLQILSKDGVNIADMKAYVQNQISVPGLYTQADINKTVKALGNLKAGVNYTETQTYKDFIGEK